MLLIFQNNFQKLIKTKIKCRNLNTYNIIVILLIIIRETAKFTIEVNRNEVENIW